MQAKFIGKDKSMGYRHGKMYNLEVKRLNVAERVLIQALQGLKCEITIKRADETGYCPYTSRETFLQNWEIVDAA